MMAQLEQLALSSLSILAQLTLHVLACLGAGTAVRRVIVMAFGSLVALSPMARLASDFLAGFGLLATVWLSLALAGWFSPGLILTLLAGSLFCTLLCISDLLAAVRQAKSIALDLWRGPASLAVLAVLVVCWILLGVTALARPLSGDALNLHMLVPKVVGSSHELTGQFLNFRNSFFGLLGEMHHAVFLSFGLVDAAKLLSWPTMMAGAVCLAAICAHCGSGRPGKWLAILMLYTSTGVLWWIGEGKIDCYSTSLGLAAVLWLLPGQSSLAGMALGGAFAAFAVQAKLAYGLTLLPALAFLSLWSPFWTAVGGHKSRSLVRSQLRGLVVAGAMFLLAMVPHVAKNLLLFGSVVGTTEADATLPTFLEEKWYGPEVSAQIQMAYPLVLSFGSYFAQYGNLSPLVLGFIPVALLFRVHRDRNPALLPISLAPLLTVVPWMIAYPDKVVVRYLLVPLLMWIPLAARGAEIAYPVPEKAGASAPAARWPSGKPGVIDIVMGLGLGLLAWRGWRLDDAAAGRFVMACAGFSFLAYRSAAMWGAQHPRELRALTFVSLVVTFVVFGSVAHMSLSLLMNPGRTVAYLSGRLSACDVQESWCRVSEVLNLEAPKGARVWSTTTYKYFMRPDLIQCSTSRPDEAAILEETDPALAWRRLRDRGIDYLLIDTRDSTAAKAQGILAAAPGRPGEVQRLFAEGPLSLFKIQWQDSDGPSRYQCRQARPPGWTVIAQEQGRP